LGHGAGGDSKVSGCSLFWRARIWWLFIVTGREGHGLWRDAVRG
jgi:hypothetical protein